MKILSVLSTKGGVGKSTISANLAVALQLSGHQVLAIDLDPQNGLGYHFSLDLDNDTGLVHASSQPESLAASIRRTASGLSLIPYGVYSETQRIAFESILAQQPHWLRDTLYGLNLDPNVIVVLDTPPGASVYMMQALSAATEVVAVVLPDAGSYVTLPQLLKLIETYSSHQPHFRDYGVIINQMNQTRLLSKDVANVLRSTFANRLIGTVHYDQAISEALAFGQSVFEYAPHSEAAHDILNCAKGIIDRLATDGYVVS